MATFKKVRVASKIVARDGRTVIVYKFVKDGTMKAFFAPEIGGKRITSTMFARLYDAENLARSYLASSKK
jgi:hypothetical protein